MLLCHRSMSTCSNVARTFMTRNLLTVHVSARVHVFKHDQHMTCTKSSNMHEGRLHNELWKDDLKYDHRHQTWLRMRAICDESSAVVRYKFRRHELRKPPIGTPDKQIYYKSLLNIIHPWPNVASPKLRPMGHVPLPWHLPSSPTNANYIYIYMFISSAQARTPPPRFGLVDRLLG